MRPVITVLIDAYNYGRFIEEAIDSVLVAGFCDGAGGDFGGG